MERRYPPGGVRVILRLDIKLDAIQRVSKFRGVFYDPPGTSQKRALIGGSDHDTSSV
jgi:hypothetical protein